MEKTLEKFLCERGQKNSEGKNYIDKSWFLFLFFFFKDGRNKACLLSSGNDPVEKGLDCWRRVLRSDGDADGDQFRGRPLAPEAWTPGEGVGTQGQGLPDPVRGVWMVPSNDLLSEQTQSHQLRVNTGERCRGFPERKGHNRFL